MKPVAAILTLGLACASAAPTDAAPLKAGTPYAAVRADLIRRGWKPIVPRLQTAFATEARASGEARQLVEAGYKEVEFCSGTGLDYCTFNFRRNGKCLKIVTQGEWNPKYKSPVVHHWSGECGFGDD